MPRRQVRKRIEYIQWDDYLTGKTETVGFFVPSKYKNAVFLCVHLVNDDANDLQSEMVRIPRDRILKRKTLFTY
jgi:hypothetical protein